MPEIKVKGHTVQTGECPQTNGRTHTHAHTCTDATKRIISPATWLIKIISVKFAKSGNIGKELKTDNVNSLSETTFNIYRKTRIDEHRKH